MKAARRNVLSLRVSDEARRLLVALSARLALKRGKRVTMTDVLEEGLHALARHEKVKV